MLFTALYASEGAPIGYIWWALPARLSADGVPVDKVTAVTALLVLPWALKFLWAPLVDTLRGPRWGLRSWIVAAQICMGLTLLPLLIASPAEHLRFAVVLLITHAFFAATQDAAIDALCISTVPKHERGALNGWMQVGMLASRAIFGGALVYIESLLEQRFSAYFARIIVHGGLIACVWFSMALVIFATREAPPMIRMTGEKRLSTFMGTLGRALKSRITWFGLLFALIGGAAFESLGSVASPMLTSLHFSKAEIGGFFALSAPVAMALGALTGGWLSDRIGRGVTVVAALVLISCLVATIGMVAAKGPNQAGAVIWLMRVNYFLIGAFTASQYALLMDVTHPVLGATQFSAFMGMTNLCESWAGFTAGSLIARYDYGIGLGIMAVAALPAIVFAGSLAARARAR